MQAIEFEAVIRERSIPLPETMMLSIGQSVRVVVMYEDQQLQAGPVRMDDAISRLAANPLVTPDFVPLSRDEAHER
jgi:hypothetical protein